MTGRKIFAKLVISICVVAGFLLHNGPAWAWEDNKNSPLPESLLAWDSLAKETNAFGNASAAQFVFNFTNVSSNSVIIQQILPSCGCTTVQSPPVPWTIVPGTNAQFSLTVRLLGKARKQVKMAEVITDHGYKILSFTVDILPPVLPAQSIADRAHALQIAKADRQAIFHGDCVTCHAKPDESEEDGRALYYEACATCHDAKDRPIITPDLFAIKTPTNVDFWLSWTAHGKAGTLMPAFSRADGGPLTDMQIAYIARFLNTSDNLDSP